jgi:hypothetical protein
VLDIIQALLVVDRLHQVALKVITDLSTPGANSRHTGHLRVIDLIDGDGISGQVAASNDRKRGDPADEKMPDSRNHDFTPILHQPAGLVR